MRKIIKISLSVIGIIIAILIIGYFLLMKGVVPVPGARTLYTGYVSIEHISLQEIKTKLEEQGCHTTDYQGERKKFCTYRESEVPFEKANGIKIYPRGPGFGPISFYLTESSLWATKDIDGPPDLNKFREEVRQDVQEIENIVKIKESSWKITDTKYPWTVVY